MTKSNSRRDVNINPNTPPFVHAIKVFLQSIIA